jgi:hypothetical protein
MKNRTKVRFFVFPSGLFICRGFVSGANFSPKRFVRTFHKLEGGGKKYSYPAESGVGVPRGFVPGQFISFLLSPPVLIKTW